MYLRRLEMQGFKTFAQKTVLEFQPSATGRRGMTGVVGPNGSGKSNIADALRWVMGEQSLKLLRAKKSEDVVFSGSAKKSRAGFAEVNMTIENELAGNALQSVEGLPELDLPEIVITRRLYRDGQSEYEINKRPVRLADVVMLLAQCGVGQRTYSVIGQGMVDAVLSASPTERKEFFDEASGLRPFQLKRQSAMLKLDATRENLKQADLLLREIEPRLASLERQAKRLKQRETIEEDLHAAERQYFGGVWSDLRAKFALASADVEKARAAFTAKNGESDALEKELAGMERAVPASQELRDLRVRIDALREDRSKLRERQIRLESRRDIANAESKKTWSPLPLSKIIARIEALSKRHEEMLAELDKPSPDLVVLKKLAAGIRTDNAELISQLQQTAPEPTKATSEPSDAGLEREFADLAREMAGIGEGIADAERQLAEANAKEDQGRARLFEIQRALTAKRHEAQECERRLSAVTVDLARLETRRDAFMSELRQIAAGLESELDTLAETAPKGSDVLPPEHMQTKVHRLRSQLEWIGGIDPETIKEYEETKTRFETLSVQAEDLRKAIGSLETVVDELDRTIKERSDVAFRQLNHEFGIYFKKLFAGGEAELMKIEPEEEAGEDGESRRGDPLGRPSGQDGEVKRKEPPGVEIHATPPGKRLKSIALLSGGERALTSIALVCAIMAINPSPFVVLDEVDAALDESNSRKFAEIVDKLAEKTQFVVVTHNRATMEKANILYGVTMGEDGVSQMLSVNLEGYK